MCCSPLSLHQSKAFVHADMTVKRFAECCSPLNLHQSKAGVFGSESGTRTHTLFDEREILSLLCLPIPPFRR